MSDGESLLATALREIGEVIDDVNRDQIRAIGAGNLLLYNARSRIDALLRDIDLDGLRFE